MTNSTNWRRWLGSIALVGSCVPNPASDQPSGESALAPRQEVVMAAIGGLALDSLCAIAGCTDFALDTVVRTAASSNALHIESLATAFYLPASEVRANWQRTVRLVIEDYPAESSVSRGAGAMGLAMVSQLGADSSLATVIATLRLPNSYGLIAVVQLRKGRGRWLVTRVVYRES